MMRVLLLGWVGLSFDVTSSSLPVRMNAVRTSVTTGGITLSVQIADDTYPRDALVLATVKMQNNSGRQLPFGESSCTADGPSPVVSVVNNRNYVVFPPALPLPPLRNVPCVQVPPPSIASGQSMSESVFVVLRGSRVRASVILPSLGIVRTPYMRIHLGPRDHARLSLRSSSPISAIFASGATSRTHALYFTDWYVCGRGKGKYVAGQVFEESKPISDGVVRPYYSGRSMVWVSASSGELVPGCAGPEQWHLAAGRLGHTVAYLNHVRG